METVQELRDYLFREKIDDEIRNLCYILNLLPFVKTLNSCSGHGGRAWICGHFYNRFFYDHFMETMNQYEPWKENWTVEHRDKSGMIHTDYFLKNDDFIWFDFYGKKEQTKEDLDNMADYIFNHIGTVHN
jgi:hypothetical protein